MVYAKNLPAWERTLRVLAGAGLALWGLLGLHGALGWVLAASGVVAALTGFVGFCPMCALAGRRIQSDLRKQKGGNNS